MSSTPTEVPAAQPSAGAQQPARLQAARLRPAERTDGWQVPSRPAPAAPAVRLNVQVNRLALEGFNLSTGGQRLVQGAFESELRRLLSAEELPALLRSGGARRDLPGALSIYNWTDAADLGRQIARAIYAGMQR